MFVDLPISEITAKFRSGSVSPVDVIEECYARIEMQDDVMHAFITLVDKDTAIAKAKKIAKDIGSLSSPLAGIPYVMKDAYLTRGVRTTAASKILDAFIPPYSATVHRKLEETGAILIGKMNMDAWGHGASTENTDYGVCKNPWDLNRSAGGSGGGPAAAVAARFCSFGIGEDTG